MELNIADNQIKKFETYLLTDNKQEFIDSLIKGSEEHLFFDLLHQINDNKKANKEDLETLNKATRSGYNAKEVLFLHNLMRRYDNAKGNASEQKEIIEELQKKFALTYNHAKPNTVTSKAFAKKEDTYPSEYPSKELSLDKFVAEALTKTEKLSQFNVNYYSRFDQEKLIKSDNKQVLSTFLNAANPTDFDKFLDILETYMQLVKDKKHDVDVPSFILERLTLDQLKQLRSKHPHFMNNLGFVNHLLIREFKLSSYNQSASTSPKERQEFLRKLYKWAEVNCTDFNDSLVLETRDELLQIGIELNEYDENLFRQYLQKPARKYNNYNNETRKKIIDHAPYSTSWNNVLDVSNWLAINSLIEAYLKHIFKTAKTISPYDTYFTESYLKRLFYRTKVQLGETVDKIHDHLSNTELSQLQESHQIEFCEYNKKYFGPGDQVNLDVLIKNVQSLRIKLFEFCPENYYLKEKKQIEGTLNLDGLVTAEESSHTFNEPAAKVITHTFKFDTISNTKRGIFIIDLIGGGMSARAVIRKGKLTYLERSNVAGQIFTILNEEKEICRGGRTGMWVQDKFYDANEKGEIFIPYSSSGQGTHNTVLVHNDFAELDNVTIKSENYSFKCSLVYSNESFLMGNKAKILAQPRLFMNNTPASFGILKEFSATVVTTTDENVPTTTVFDNLKPNNNEELVLEFTIPPRLRRVDVSVDAKVGQMYSQNDLNFNFFKSIDVNLHQGSNELCQIYLRYTQKGYELCVLGKNGEPKPNIRVHTTLHNKYYSQNFTKVLQTDEKGRVQLGKLEDINMISATTDVNGDINRCNRNWKINSDERVNYPSQLTLVEGDNINFPLLHSEHSKHKFTFIETLESGETLRNALSELKVEKNVLKIQGLKEGHYTLTFKDVGQTCHITVIKGQYWKHDKDFVVTEDSIQSVKNQVNNIVITDVNVDSAKSTLSITAYADAPKVARFHILGAQFMEEDPNCKVNKLNQNVPSIENESATISTRRSMFLNNRKLGDEYVYVLDRKDKTRFMGNTLERPQILLKRTFVQDTSTVQENLATGENFAMDARQQKAIASDDKSRHKKKKKMPSSSVTASGSHSNQGIESFMNFLQSSALICENQKLDANGQIVLENFPVGKYSHIQIVATNLISSIQQIVPLPDTPIQTRDLSLKSQMKNDQFYSISYGNSVLLAKEQMAIKDMTSTELKIIDSVNRLFDVQKALRLTYGSDNENTGGYDFWKFLKEWNTLSQKQKIKKYDDFASHELNIFLYLRDREFFDSVVKGFISNKIEKHAVDYILLDDKERILKLANGQALKQLNCLETALLVMALHKHDKDSAKFIAEAFANQGQLNKPDHHVFKRLFETVLKSKTQGEDMPEHTKERMAEPKMMARKCKESAPMSASLSMVQSFGVQRSMASSKKMAFREEAKCMDESEEEEEEAQGCFDDDDDEFGGSNTALKMRENVKTGFQEMGKTKEYKERQYYKTSSVNISLNLFWVDLFNHLAAHGTSKPFLPESLIYANRNHTEMIGALSFISVPFAASSHKFDAGEGLGLKISAASDMVVFQKEIKEATPSIKPEILISQRFFDPADRYTTSKEDPGVRIEKEVEQFVIDKVYGCKVTVTNCSIANQEFQVLVEIPQGSIPVKLLDYTKSHNIPLNSTTTQFIEFFFYFPKDGNYSIYPASVSKQGKIQAQAKPQSIQVDKERVFKNLESFTAILSQGSEQDIINFVKSSNLWDSQIFKFNDIWWLLKNKSFYDQFIQTLRQRKVFDATTWSYGFMHNDAQAVKEYLSEVANRHFPGVQYANYSLIQIDRRQLREYHPYVNPRVHLVASEKNQILNIQLKQQYRSYVRYCCEVDKLRTEHYLTLVYYFLLQDRIEDALKMFARINPEDVKKDHEQELQYDYFAAYVDFYTGYPNFKVAREVSKKHIDYPVLSWRSLFVDVANQLAEFDGTAGIEQDKEEQAKAEDKSKENLKNAEKEEILSMELDKTKLIINYQNIKNISVFFYIVDIEILFSRNPFLSQTKDELTFIKANHIHELKISDSKELQKSYYELPPNLQKENLFIQLRSGDRIISLNYFSTQLDVQIIESFGQVKVSDAEGKPLSKVYVKCFAKAKNNGSCSFYKDGYTDLRGRFDFATLSGGDVSNVDKFALLIVSDEHGGLIKETTPPKKIGK